MKQLQKLKHRFSLHQRGAWVGRATATFQTSISTTWATLAQLATWSREGSVGTLPLSNSLALSLICVTTSVRQHSKPRNLLCSLRQENSTLWRLTRQPFLCQCQFPPNDKYWWLKRIVSIMTSSSSGIWALSDTVSCLERWLWGLYSMNQAWEVIWRQSHWCPRRSQRQECLSS